MLLDEVTSALDPELVGEVLDPAEPRTREFLRRIRL
jgi:ABC-type polar amino acid transport system ATPase subunit